MRKTYSYLFLVLGMTIILMIMPANAGEVSVTFDEGRLCDGEEIGNTYSDQGITFSPGTKLIDTGYLSSKKDMGFWNPDNRITQIYFSPAVISVSIDFENTLAGNLDAFLVNGKVLSISEYNCEWTSKNTLRIESSDANIRSISISSKLPCSKEIKFDNLCYEQVTEISENSSCGNNESFYNTDNEDPEDENRKISSGKSKNADNTAENIDNEEEIGETPEISGNDIKSDNADNEDCEEEIEETPEISGNDIKSDNADNEDCEEEIEETPEISGNDTKSDNADNEDCEEEIEETPGISGNDTKSDNSDNEDCEEGIGETPGEEDSKSEDMCPDIPESSPCKNETEPDDSCPKVPADSSCEENTKPDKPCNQEIPEYPTIALPVVTVIGMILIFQRRQN